MEAVSQWQHNTTATIKQSSYRHICTLKLQEFTLQLQMLGTQNNGITSSVPYQMVTLTTFLILLRSYKTGCIRKRKRYKLQKITNNPTYINSKTHCHTRSLKTDMTAYEKPSTAGTQGHSYRGKNKEQIQ